MSHPLPDPPFNSSTPLPTSVSWASTLELFLGEPIPPHPRPPLAPLVLTTPSAVAMPTQHSYQDLEHSLEREWGWVGD